MQWHQPRAIVERCRKVTAAKVRSVSKAWTMIGKMKKWLGIEGVKMELVLPEGFSPRQGALSGTVRLMSKNAQTVTAIKFAVIEKYSRGRNEETLVDEYELGSIVLRDTIDVPAEGRIVEVPFRVPFAPLRSPVEAFGDKNPVYQGLAWLAKKSRNATSEFRIEAEAQVRGVGLNPFDKKVLG